MEIDFSNLTSEKITDFHCLETFCSGVEAMDKFIQGDFRMSVENHYCSAYGVWYKEELVAIYALSFDSLDLDSDDKEELETGNHLQELQTLTGTTRKHFMPSLVIQLLIQPTQLSEKNTEAIKLGSLLLK